MRALVLDLETSGLDPMSAEVVEIGWVIVEEGGLVPPPRSTLVKPNYHIPAECTAIHHITDAMVEASPSFVDAIALLEPEFETVTHYVAHNIEFERTFLDGMIPERPWICTYRCALHLYPHAPAHNNQTLRYWMNTVSAGNTLAEPPHRAGPDAYVTAHTLQRMRIIKQPGELVSLTQQPAILHKMPFGKHFGLPMDKLPTDYLQWIVKQRDIDRDVLHTAQELLKPKRVFP